MKNAINKQALVDLTELIGGAVGANASALTSVEKILGTMDERMSGSVAYATGALRDAFLEWYGPAAKRGDAAPEKAMLWLNLAKLKRALA